MNGVPAFFQFSPKEQYMDPRWIVDLLTRGRKRLVAPLKPSGLGLSAWVSVRSLDASDLSARLLFERHELSQEEITSAKFFVFAFEMDMEVAKSDKFGPNDMLKRREFFASSLDEVSVILASLGTSLCNLDLPWKSEFPLE